MESYTDNNMSSTSSILAAFGGNGLAAAIASPDVSAYFAHSGYHPDALIEFNLKGNPGIIRLLKLAFRMHLDVYQNKVVSRGLIKELTAEFNNTASKNVVHALSLHNVHVALKEPKPLFLSASMMITSRYLRGTTKIEKGSVYLTADGTARIATETAMAKDIDGFYSQGYKAWDHFKTAVPEALVGFRKKTIPDTLVSARATMARAQKAFLNFQASENAVEKANAALLPYHLALEMVEDQLLNLHWIGDQQAVRIVIPGEAGNRVVTGTPPAPRILGRFGQIPNPLEDLPEAFRFVNGILAARGFMTRVAG